MVALVAFSDAFVCLLKLIALVSLYKVSAAVSMETNQAEELYTVKLRRQQVPVGNEGEDVYYKTAYSGMVSVGYPGTEFEVVFDTGSGHLLLPSTMCHSETCRAHRRYRRAKSTTAADIDYDGTRVLPGQSRDQITIAFGTGEVTGVFVQDVVCIGPQRSRVDLGSGLSRNNSATSVGAVAPQPLRQGCVDLRLIAATDMSAEPFASFEFDGVLGLGLSDLSQTPEFNFLSVVAEQMADSPGLNPNVFAVFLADSESEESEITFGGWRDEHMLDGPNWAPVSNPEFGYWQIKINAVRIGNRHLEFCREGCRAVVDTGTSLLAVPTKVFREIESGLRHPATKGKCPDGVGPELHFDLDGNVTVTLQPDEYARAERPVGSPKPESEEEAERQRATMACEPMLMSLDLEEPLGPKLWILGEPVLRKYYTVYNTKAQSVGFGLASHMPAFAGGETQDEVFKDPLEDDSGVFEMPLMAHACTSGVCSSH